MSDKTQKFMFDRNIFNVDVAKEEELPPEPPPPTFSEGELEAARAEGFSRGKEEGLRESRASRDQYIAGTLDSLTKSFKLLFDAESKREKLYEAEAIHLTFSVLERLFPTLNREHGFDEIKAHMVSLLENYMGQAEISVDVATGEEQELHAYVAQAVERAGMTYVVNVRGNPSLAPGEFRLSWKNGGALRDITHMADKINDILKTTYEKKRVIITDDDSDGPAAN